MSSRYVEEEKRHQRALISMSTSGEKPNQKKQPDH